MRACGLVVVVVLSQPIAFLRLLWGFWGLYGVFDLSRSQYMRDELRQSAPSGLIRSIELLHTYNKQMLYIGEWFARVREGKQLC